MTTRPRRLTSLAIVAAFALSACGGGEGDEAPSTTASATGESQAAESGSASSDESAVEPAEPQTIEIGETQTVSKEGEAFTLTVHKVVVQDYYVEAEITLINDGDDDLEAWYGHSSVSAPLLYDDRGRSFAFQPQAGGKGESLRLLPGEGVEAVLVFAGAVDTDAQSLTLDWSELGDNWSQVTFDVPLQGAK